MTKFGELKPDGTLTNVRDIPQSALTACPHFILDPSHYRSDNTCRCDDRDHVAMRTWGYTWDGHRWV